MKLGKTELKRLIADGETNKVEFKIASPRPSEMAERLCGMTNAQGGLIIIGIRDADLEIVGVPDDRLALTMDVIHRAAWTFVITTLLSIIVSLTTSLKTLYF
jgi:predicted HTH transcriptional regulator